MDGEKIATVFLFVLLVLLILSLLIGVPVGIIDTMYKLPQASERANQICQEQGYDFYESFERIGILSTEPVAIKCKYVDNYKEMDIALRKTYTEE